MLAKEPTQLALADTQTFSQIVDARFVECAALDQRERSCHRVRRSVPGCEARRNFGSATQARSEAGGLRGCRGKIEQHVLATGRPNGADRTAEDARRPA